MFWALLTGLTVDLEKREASPGEEVHQETKLSSVTSIFLPGAHKRRVTVQSYAYCCCNIGKQVDRWLYGQGRGVKERGPIFWTQKKTPGKKRRRKREICKEFVKAYSRKSDPESFGSCRGRELWGSIWSWPHLCPTSNTVITKRYYPLFLKNWTQAVTLSIVGQQSIRKTSQRIRRPDFVTITMRDKTQPRVRYFRQQWSRGESFTHHDLGFKCLNLHFLLNSKVEVQGTIEREKNKGI